MSPNRWYNGNNKNHMETAEMERIMKTTIIGFPRVGSLRELKFASEKYFRNEITAQELEQTARQLRAAHWNLQKEAGIGLIPEDRKAQGCVLSLTIRENIVYSILKKISKVSVVQKKQEKEIVDQYIKELNVKTPSPEQLVKNLSGGNQQKVVLAKALATNCEILIFDEPTRGIDVGAKQEIYNLMCKLVEAGKSIIMISSEMPELIGMSDRIVVMSNGENAGELSKGEYDQTHLLEMASSKL